MWGVCVGVAGAGGVGGSGEGETGMMVKGQAAREVTPKGNVTQGLLPGP